MTTYLSATIADQGCPAAGSGGVHEGSPCARCGWRERLTLTAGQLRQALADVPDDAEVLVHQRDDVLAVEVAGAEESCDGDVVLRLHLTGDGDDGRCETDERFQGPIGPGGARGEESGGERDQIVVQWESGRGYVSVVWSECLRLGDGSYSGAAALLSRFFPGDVEDCAEPDPQHPRWWLRFFSGGVGEYFAAVAGLRALGYSVREEVAGHDLDGVRRGEADARAHYVEADLDVLARAAASGGPLPLDDVAARIVLVRALDLLREEREVKRALPKSFAVESDGVRVGLDPYAATHFVTDREMYAYMFLVACSSNEREHVLRVLADHPPPGPTGPGGDRVEEQEPRGDEVAGEALLDAGAEPEGQAAGEGGPAGGEGAAEGAARGLEPLGLTEQVRASGRAEGLDEAADYVETMCADDGHVAGLELRARAARVRDALPFVRRLRAPGEAARARMTPEQRDYIDRFEEHQAGRDHAQEWRDYVAKTVLRLFSAGAEVARWPLAALPDYPRENPALLAWRRRYFRVNAIVPTGVIDDGEATAGFEHEITGYEVGVGGEDPLRDYEREAYRLPDGFDAWHWMERVGLAVCGANRNMDKTDVAARVTCPACRTRLAQRGGGCAS